MPIDIPIETFSIEYHLLTKAIGVAQPLKFTHAPVSCLGVWASGAGLIARFLVRPGVPGKTCNAWVWNFASTSIQGGTLPGHLPPDSQLFATSDCFETI